MDEMWEDMKRRFLDSSLSRHDSIARLFDRLVEPKWSYRFMVLLAMANAVILTNPLMFLFGVFLLWNRTWKPVAGTVALWEALFWILVVFASLVFVAALFGGTENRFETMVHAIAVVLEYLGYCYALADRYQPPRMRKKREPAPARAKLEYEGLIT